MADNTPNSLDAQAAAPPPAAAPPADADAGGPDRERRRCGRA